MARSFALVCTVAVLAALAIAAPRTAHAITCTDVFNGLQPCLNYIRGMGPLTATCCSGVKGLNTAAGTTAARQAACACLKNLSTQLKGINLGLAGGVPGKCNVNVGYPISPSVDCSKVK